MPRNVRECLGRWQQLQQHLEEEEEVGAEGLLEEWCYLANLNCFASCLPDCFHCSLSALSCAPTRGPEWGLGTTLAPACRRWLRGLRRRSHCLHVNDEVDEGEYGLGRGLLRGVWAVCGCGGGAGEASGEPR